MTVHASSMRNRFVSERTAKPKHSRSFYSHVSFLLAILEMMPPSANRMFLGFRNILSLSSDPANIQSVATTIAGFEGPFFRQSLSGEQNFDW